MDRLDTIALNIVQTLRQPLLILNSGLEVQQANDAFYRVFKTGRSATTGHYIYKLGNGQWDIPSLRELLEEIIPYQATIEDFEVEHLFPDLGRRIMLLNARRLEQDGARDGLILLAIEDVTERRTAEKKLREFNRALQRSNEELQQFAYVASHDLQEPLRAISGYVQLLERRYGEHFDEKGRHYVTQVVAAVTRMQTLINDLLAYSRVDSRGQPFVKTDCNEIVADVLRNLETVIDDCAASIHVDPLPLIQADGPQLTSVFQNLIHNGLKYRSAELPEIHITAEQQDGEWLFSIADNGIGIHPDYFERIFAIFQRLHTRREYPGTGIGLAVARRIVQRHGGRIWVESDGEKGSRFLFTLPMREA